MCFSWSAVAIASILTIYSCSNSTASQKSSSQIRIVHNSDSSKYDVFYNQQFFTSYLYDEALVKKPVLYPLFSAKNIRVTRGFPFDPKVGERIDHPHHYSVWHNHGNVNRIDYWNSSEPPKKPDGIYGEIKHLDASVIETAETSSLVTVKCWITNDSVNEIMEKTKYSFYGDHKTRKIYVSITLTAQSRDIIFEDSKEGFFALRVRKELESPSTQPHYILTKDLSPSEEKIVDTTYATGEYLNSRGVRGYPAVWGQRARWMSLTGKVGNDNLTILMFDHPKNINHPPHWMTRDYGLYAVNPFGTKVYSKGLDSTNYYLKQGDYLKLNYQIVIIDGIPPSSRQIDSMFNSFITLNMTI